MHYHSNVMYCTQSHWTDEMYESAHYVRIPKYVPGGSLELDPDWKTLIDVIDVMDTEKQARYLEQGLNYVSAVFKTQCPSLKPEVLAWITDIVTPPKSPADYKFDQWGWAMGSDSFRLHNPTQFELWFYRRSDAMAFIRKWSIHKKPTSYFNYFSGHRWELDANGKRQLTKKRLLIAK